ncbi:2-iminoacetate synthase ThiH [Eisenibacter elegans]|uniref:2-iminoacetate synthase ThiH n=1 Tax=Eisenibacter elegans TaxID=997 RepID=UPI000402FA79|nr:2-iminoacetate synthase ThiH [Eisenibacter elegans]
MQSFKDLIANYEWQAIQDDIYRKSAADVVRALAKPGRLDLEDFKALVSPAAAAYLEPMAQRSHQQTQQRFGKTIQMYIPLYLSNECQNICTYCGFSLDVPIARKTLSEEEILAEMSVIKQMGYEHVLLVTGEANKTVGVEYLQCAIRLLRPHFAHIAMEVQPLEQAEYALLRREGLHTVLVYQETYHREEYKTHHPKGKKSNFDYRLDTHDRLGRAGIQKMGLGVLLGLEDWRTDSFFCAAHLQYLEKTYWQSKYSISFPRLRPCAGGLNPKVQLSDRELVQLICAYRLLSDTVELSLSTRESPHFRDHVLKLGITSMSADSKTDPGGYANPNMALEQFEIDDKRPTTEVVASIRRQGYEPVFKNAVGIGDF